MVVSYSGKTIPRWRTAAILKIDISPYLSEILYTAADFELDERHVTKNEKVALDKLRVRQNVFLLLLLLLLLLIIIIIIITRCHPLQIQVPSCSTPGQVQSANP